MAAVLAAACTAHHPASLPAGPALVRRSAATMRSVQSVRFSLAIEGHPGALGIRRADGVMARGSRLSGTVQLEESGDLAVLKTCGRPCPGPGRHDLPRSVGVTSYDVEAAPRSEEGMALRTE